MTAPVDVLAVRDDIAQNVRGIWDTNQRTGNSYGNDLHEAFAAVAELIEAAAYALRTRDEAGALSDTAEYNLRQALIDAGGAP